MPRRRPGQWSSCPALTEASCTCNDYGHFELLGGPDADFGAEATARHAESVERMQKIILSD